MRRSRDGKRNANLFAEALTTRESAAEAETGSQIRIEGSRRKIMVLEMRRAHDKMEAGADK